jgi:hypothetical protein
VTAEDHILHVVVRFFERRQLDRRLEHAGLDIFEAGRAQALGGDLGVGELPRAGPAVEVRGVWLGGHQAAGALADAGDVRAGAALSDQPAAWLERVEHRSEQSRMVAHPVKRGVAEGQIGDLIQVELVQRLLDVLDATAELRLQVFTGCFEHVGGAVDGEHAPPRQAAQQELGQSPAATAQVQRCFIAAQGQALDDSLAPGLHRRRQAGIGARIPFSHFVY